MFLRRIRADWRVPVILVASLCALPLRAAPLLRCEVSYGGETRIVEASPRRDPYGVHGEDISGRFRFKAVVVGDEHTVDYVTLYVYYQADPQPLLLHEAKYLPPFPPSGRPHGLTGLNYVYAPGLGYELQYGCTLNGAAP